MREPAGTVFYPSRVGAAITTQPDSSIGKNNLFQAKAELWLLNST